MIPAASSNPSVGNDPMTEASKMTSVSAPSSHQTTPPLSTPFPSLEATSKDLGLTPMEVDQVLDSSLKDAELSTEEAALASSYLVEFASGGVDGVLEKSSTTSTTAAAMMENVGKSSPSIEITLDSDGMLGGRCRFNQIYFLSSYFYIMIQTYTYT